MNKLELILASGSPRRRQLLQEAGYQFRTLPARDGVEERAEGLGICSNCGPATLVTDLATAKGTDVVEQLLTSQQGNQLVVLAADTVAECDGHILGKPVDHEHARLMMSHLSGRKHQVFTGVFLAKLIEDKPSNPIQFAVETTLSMDKLSESWIDKYVQSEKWQGKAGGFGYQDGLEFVHISQGSESNVVGLPMEEVTKQLSALGVTPA